MHSDDDHAGAARQGERAFFGRRKGKKLRPRQAGLFETLLPRLALDLSLPAPADPRILFPDPVDQLCLEIGFGGGEHLITQAGQFPRTGFIGVEPFVNGMAKALVAIEAEAMRNIRLHHGDATEVVAWLGPQTTARVDLIYPDPWPKRRHWKRRFVQDDSVAGIARILRAGGEFRFVSDIPDYAAWTLQRVLRSGLFSWTAERADDWRKPFAGFQGTRYEAKAKAAGRVPCYLTFRKP